MRKKPWILNMLTLSYLIIALSFPLQIAFMYGHDLAEMDLIFKKITVLNYIVMFLCALNAAHLYVGSNRVLLWTPISMVFVALNNFTVAKYSENFSNMQVIMATVGFMSLSLFLLTPSVLKILKNQDLRWWRVSPRLRIPINVTLIDEQLNRYHCQIFDISKSGAFIELSSKDVDNLQLCEGKQLRLITQFSHNDELTVNCRAQIMRLNLQSGPYPSGIGVKFLDLRPAIKWRLGRIIMNANAS